MATPKFNMCWARPEVSLYIKFEVEFDYCQEMELTMYMTFFSLSDLEFQDGRPKINRCLAWTKVNLCIMFQVGKSSRNESDYSWMAGSMHSYQDAPKKIYPSVFTLWGTSLNGQTRQNCFKSVNELSHGIVQHSKEWVVSFNLAVFLCQLNTGGICLYTGSNVDICDDYIFSTVIIERF